jgi:hypothetical protein
MAGHELWAHKTLEVLSKLRKLYKCDLGTHSPKEKNVSLCCLELVPLIARERVCGAIVAMYGYHVEKD